MLSSPAPARNPICTTENPTAGMMGRVMCGAVGGGGRVSVWRSCWSPVFLTCGCLVRGVGVWRWGAGMTCDLGVVVGAMCAASCYLVGHCRLVSHMACSVPAAVLKARTVSVDEVRGVAGSVGEDGGSWGGGPLRPLQCGLGRVWARRGETTIRHGEKPLHWQPTHATRILRNQRTADLTARLLRSYPMQVEMGFSRFRDLVRSHAMWQSGPSNRIPRMGV